MLDGLYELVEVELKHLVGPLPALKDNIIFDTSVNNLRSALTLDGELVCPYLQCN